MARRLPPKCRNACVPGHQTRIWIEDRTYVVTTCAICKRPMSELDKMKPRIALVKDCG